MPTPMPQFHRHRGVAQLVLRNAADLALIHQLEEARWVATSAPSDNFFADPGFLAALDADGDGRLRVQELKAAHRWTVERLARLDALSEGKDALTLKDLSAEHADGPALVELMRRLLTELGHAEADALSLEAVRTFRGSYAQKFPNGDGVVTAAQVEDEALGARVAEVVAATGGAKDLSGEQGVSAEVLAAFRTLAEERIAWEAEGAAPGSAVLPFGAETAGLAATLGAIAPKVDQFFAQCDLVSLEEAAPARLQASPEALATLDVRDTAALGRWAAEAPLARPTAEGVLELAGKLNPHYAEAVGKLGREVAPPALGRASVARLTRADWAAVKARFAPFQAWQARRGAALPEAAAAAALRATLEGAELRRLDELVLADGKVSEELRLLGDLEKLLLHCRWLLAFANNFVAMPSLFQQGQRALFQAGDLVIDGRVMNFCVRVNDRASHKVMAEKSAMFVAYVELTRKEGEVQKKQEIAAALTSGTRGAVDVGKRGIFYDRDRNEWDARVVEVLVQPISLWESAIAPFTRLKSFVLKRVESMVGEKAGAMEKGAVASADKTTTTAVAAATTTPTLVAPGAPPAAAAQASPSAGGSNLSMLLVGGGVAFAALGSTLAFVLRTLSEINPVNLLLAVAGTVLGIMALSGFLGWLKLRQRNLATVLEAGGWALNARLMLTRPHSLLFTYRPRLPKGSQVQTVHVVRSAGDDEGGAGWVWVVLALLLGAAAYLYLHPEHLPGSLRPAPAASAAPAGSAP